MTTQDRGITLRDWEVRAVLNGATQLRRVVKPQPPVEATEVFTWFAPEIPAEVKAAEGLYCRCPSGLRFLMHAPFQPGQRLWVRERYGLEDEGQGYLCRGCPVTTIHYTDGQVLYISRTLNMRRPTQETQWYSASTMTKQHSRITLEVTGTGAGRVQEITENDVKLLGIDERSPLFNSYEPDYDYCPLDGYKRRWNADNKQYPWRDNPWNWVYGVRMIE